MNTDTVVDSYSYAYDRDGNVVTKNNVGYANANSGSTDFNENYTYDSLSRLTTVSQGTASSYQGFALDAMGNPIMVTTLSTAQNRTVNADNQLTNIGTSSLTYDDNGNTTTDDHGNTLIYDAWNRLVAVENASGVIIKAYQYDGLGRLISETDGTTTTDFYYSNNWQIIEERSGVTTAAGLSTGSNGTVSAEYVFSPIYVNAALTWDKDTNGDGTLDRRLYYTSDANFDVTSVVATSGSVQERVVYDAYGNASFYSSSWSALFE